MSKLSMLKRSKRQRALVLKYLMYPQRIIVPAALMDKPLPPYRDNLWSMPDPATELSTITSLTEEILQRHVNPYGRSADL